MTLRARLALLYGSLASVSLALALLLAYGFYERGAYRNTDGILMVFTRIAAERLERPGATLRFLPTDIPVTLRQFDAKGQLVAEDRGAEVPPMPLALGPGRPAHSAWVAALPVVSETQPVLDGYGLERHGGVRWRSYTLRLPDGGALQAIISLERTDAVLARVQNNYAVFGLGGVLLVMLLGFAISGPALRPVARLTQLAGEVARARDPHFRLAGVRRSDEFGRLGATFNAMLESLEAAAKLREEALDGEREARLAAEAAAEALKHSEARLLEMNEAQRRFVGDAAHELRAPLTSIRGNLSLLERYPDMPVQDRLEAAREAEREAARLARLISDLLAVARGEAQGQLFVESVRLERLLEEAWRSARALSDRRRFDLGALEPCTVSGDPDALKQLALILLENAVKYSPDGGLVRLELRRSENWAEVRVSDNGPGIAPEELERVFERFYRADRSRSRANGPGGSGLGLTIARQIAVQHGGALHLESQPGGGTMAVLRLPCARG